MLRLTRGLSSYYIEVSRAGKSVVLTMPCEAQVASRLFDSELRLLTALTRGNWYACMDSGETIINTFGTAISRTFSRMGSCAQLADEDDNKQGEYFFGEALGLTLEIRALAPQPEEMRKQILELLLRLDYLRVSGGVDHATKLRAAMTNVGLTPPEFNASAFIERVLEAAKTLPKTAATGTGFVVHPSGVIVTANHVIDGASTITAQCGAGTPLDATVRSKSAALDLAVLAVRAPAPLMYLDVARDVADIQLGSSIFTIGFPVTELLGNDAKYTEGTISGLSGVAGDASFFQVSVPIQPGNSGGALVDSRGRVIGVVLSTASAPLFLGLTGSLPQNVNWAVKSPAVRSLFMPPAARPAAGSREAAIKQAVAATCFIRATP
jgi:S1-C subfamily serine protease